MKESLDAQLAILFQLLEMESENNPDVATFQLYCREQFAIHLPPENTVTALTNALESVRSINRYADEFSFSEKYGTAIFEKLQEIYAEIQERIKNLK